VKLKSGDPWPGGVVKVNFLGEFGNNIMQMMFGILVGEALGYKVQLPRESPSGNNGAAPPPLSVFRNLYAEFPLVCMTIQGLYLVRT